MLELQGKYATAKVFTDVVDQASISQVIQLLNQPYAAGSRVRMMPDIHAGAGCTVGTTMTVGSQICPNLVGVDIGCGMETARIREDHLEMQQLDVLIREKIPSGFEIHKYDHRRCDEAHLDQLCCAKHVDLLRANKSLGTLGGGNHFIEVDRDDEGRLYIVIHSGSRHLGLEIANWYQKAGYNALTTWSQEERNAVIDNLKAQGRQKDIEKALKAMGKKSCGIPFPLAYVEGELLEQYLHDMHIAQNFAVLNRQVMLNEIVKGLKLHVEEQFTTIHNYIDVKAHILRKGAVSAQAGEQLLIPINMRDGSLICVGRGNEDWNFSAPHGAGRLMSRSEARESLTVSEFRKQMEGIYTTSVGRSTLDESPMAYKGMSDIVDNIGPTAEIRKIIRPVYNFKAGGEE